MKIVKEKRGKKCMRVHTNIYIVLRFREFMVSREVLDKRRSRIEWIKVALRDHPDVPAKDVIFQVAQEFNCAVRKAQEDYKFVKWGIENDILSRPKG